MRPKSLVLLALALGCGLIASIGISQVMEARSGAPVAVTETELILVAMFDIDRSTDLSAENVKLEAWPLDRIPEGSIKSFEEIEGLRPGMTISAGLPILTDMIGTGENSRAALEIPVGMRSIAVRISNTSGAGLIRPGDRVDVQIYARKNLAVGITRSITETFLQDVTVFAVGASIRDEGDDQLAAKTISLLVTPSQANLVTHAESIGTLRLIMRGASDNTEEKTLEGATASSVLQGSEKLGKKSDGVSNSSPLAKLFHGGTSAEPKAITEPEPPSLITLTPVVREPDQFKMEIFSGPDSRVKAFEGDKPVDEPQPHLGVDNDEIEQ